MSDIHDIIARTLAYYVLVIMALGVSLFSFDYRHVTRLGFVIIVFSITVVLYIKLVYDWKNLKGKKDVE